MKVVNQWRQECLGLRHRLWTDREMLGSYGSSIPILYSYSPHVIPQPSDWNESAIATGYWFLDSAADFVPPPRIVDFLAAGKPPVCIGFGSMRGRNPRALTEIVLTTLLSGRMLPPIQNVFK
jgi:sterol 3beta-glucosyltransferase